MEVIWKIKVFLLLWIGATLRIDRWIWRLR